MATGAGGNYNLRIPEITDVPDVPVAMTAFANDLDPKLAAVDKQARFMNYYLNVPFSFFDTTKWTHGIPGSNRCIFRCYGGSMAVGAFTLGYSGSPAIAIPADGNIADQTLMQINDTRFYPAKATTWVGQLSGSEYSAYGYVHQSTGRVVLSGLLARSGAAGTMPSSGIQLRFVLHYGIIPIPINVDAAPGTPGPSGAT